MEAVKDGQVVPQGLPGVAGGQAEADAIAPLVDAAADLEQAQAQRVQLRARDVPNAQPAVHGVEQPGGRRVQ